ncbi:MAG TPA: uracil-DNA glycosylase family protein [Candidatus Dormibacteraeota bacterium]|nr:uracil-DNA glycosylase family protein [Candidatus Dormibacteraeota bacterium]
MTTATTLLGHATAHRACTVCADAGWITAARPVFSGRPGQRILLVGQAPGPVEADGGRPFAGRAGRELMRWLSRAGFRDEADVRERVWMTSVTTCFPGRRASGDGDRRPGSAEVRACAHWLDGVLTLLRPRLVMAVGTLAVSRLLPGSGGLEDVVGRRLALPAAALPAHLEPPEAEVVALPHPSGQSRWLNDAAHRARLETALLVIAEIVARVESTA